MVFWRNQGGGRFGWLFGTRNTLLTGRSWGDSLRGASELEGSVPVWQSMRFALTFSAGIRPEFFWGFRKCIKGCKIFILWGGEHVCIKAWSNIFDTRRLLWEPCPRQMLCNESTSTQLLCCWNRSFETFYQRVFPQIRNVPTLKCYVPESLRGAPVPYQHQTASCLSDTTGDSDQRAGLPRKSGQQLGSVVTIDWDITWYNLWYNPSNYSYITYTHIYTYIHIHILIHFFLNMI